MKTALVLGGTRFFGVNLVEELLAKGVKVTIATRGQSKDSFGDRVDRLIIDRMEKDSLLQTTRGRTWDVVFDQLCYSSHGAAVAVEVFENKIQHYVLTSSISVYDFSKEPYREEDFNPYTYPSTYSRKENVSYQEGKRQAESMFFQHAPFSVTAVRFPIVLGEKDYTNRLTFHIEKVAHGEQIGLLNSEISMNFISQEEAGAFLVWCGQKQINGAVNACADGEITLKELIYLIEEKVGKKAIVTNKLTDENASPYGIEYSWIMSNEKASLAGYTFTNLHNWLPGLIGKIVDEQRNIQLN